MGPGADARPRSGGDIARRHLAASTRWRLGLRGALDVSPSLAFLLVATLIPWSQGSRPDRTAGLASLAQLSHLVSRVADTTVRLTERLASGAPPSEGAGHPGAALDAGEALQGDAFIGLDEQASGSQRSKSRARAAAGARQRAAGDAAAADGPPPEHMDFESGAHGASGPSEALREELGRLGGAVKQSCKVGESTREGDQQDASASQARGELLRSCVGALEELGKVARRSGDNMMHLNEEYAGKFKNTMDLFHQLFASGINDALESDRKVVTEPLLQQVNEVSSYLEHKLPKVDEEAFLQHMAENTPEDNFEEEADA